MTDRDAAQGRTEVLEPDEDGIRRAAAALRAGLLVAFPTETVYGLGADATDGVAVAGIYAAKGRPSFNPLIVHVPDAAAAERVASFDGRARELAAAFWPGPLTLVLPRRPDAGISDLVCAGLETVGVRVPRHTVARRLLAAAGRPVAAPSANRSGRVSPTTARHVLDDLGGRVPLVLEGGGCEVGLESTVLDLTSSRPVLLRPGAVVVEALEERIGPVDRGGPDPSRPRSPGQIGSHYAPRARVRLDAGEVGEGEALLTFGPDPREGPRVRNLSPAGDLREAAAHLFAHLRELDATGAHTIAVVPIPGEGLGRAILDRLRRAAAPREG
ncbi:threonylcarbamoyl-AMP synthase [Myxococcota bacterium]|nr:threonylcarbamoyl-AMP synthase [Myxococcota bacterium]